MRMHRNRPKIEDIRDIEKRGEKVSMADFSTLRVGTAADSADMDTFSI